MGMRRSIAVLLLGFCVLMASVPAAAGQGASEPVLVLDAGHGGEDGGAVDPSGHKESDINLAIVRKLRDLMAFLGVEAVLTRTEDVSICDRDCVTLREKKVSDLKNRAALIGAIENAVVVSVHQNSFTDSRYHGPQVFYNRGEAARLWGEETQKALNAALGGSRSAAPVREDIYLFSHIGCPAILVECGFLSNGEEAALLRTDSYQRTLAAVLAAACFRQMQVPPAP